MFACAAKLPHAEVDAANIAFAEAQTAQAEVLAAAAFSAAAAANDALQANLNAKEYGKTKALAKTLLDASVKARIDSTAGLEAAKTDVAQLANYIAAELPAVQRNFTKAARSDSAQKAKVDLKAISAGLAAAPKALADAQALSDAVASLTALKVVKAGLDSFKASLEAAGFKD